MLISTQKLNSELQTFEAAVISDGTTVDSDTPAEPLTTNYRKRIRNVLSWQQFPVKVCFVHNDQYTVRRHDAAIAGFQAWVDSTDRYVQFTEVSDPAASQVLVEFDGTSNDGLTKLRFRGHAIRSAEVHVGANAESLPDVTAVAAHEFGHALGLDGHSDSRMDLMYPVHYMGTRPRISSRDLNTLAQAYPELGL